MELSRDINIAFRQVSSCISILSSSPVLTFVYPFAQHVTNMKSDALSTIDLTVSILTMGYWPSYPVVEVNLPKELVAYQELFNKFYLGKHSGRKLQWQPTLGHCMLRATFENVRQGLLNSFVQSVTVNNSV